MMDFSASELKSKIKHYYRWQIFFVLSAANTCYGFFEWQSNQQTEAWSAGRDTEATAEAIVFARPFLWIAQTRSSEIFDAETDHISGGVLRLIGSGEFGDGFDWYLNAATVYVSDEFDLPFFINNANNNQPERSGLLTNVINDEKQQSIFVDQIYGRYTLRNTDIIFGRQPINLASTVYFTPNDFFAPFAAQTFFRDFKFGVDAVRLEHALQNLTQLSFFYVLGYQQDDSSASTINSFADSPESGRASKLFQMSSVLGSLEWKLLGGRVLGDPVLGGAVQGELFLGLGIRAEGHHRRQNNQQGGHISQWSLGFEHQFNPDLGARVEFFFNSAGISEQENYAVLFAQLTNPADFSSGLSPGFTLAESYMATGVDYQISPLWTMSALIILNQVDDSYLAAIDFNYSLSNESTVNIGLSLPEGDGPELNAIQSEFGLYPRSVTLELRVYY